MTGRLLLLLAALALLPLSALAEGAEAPFDLAALRDAWPGEERVYLSSSWHAGMTKEGVLRTVRRAAVAVLDDSARDDLALFEFEQRPGCRELVELESRVVDPWGAEQRLTLGELLQAPMGDHPTDPTRSGVSLRGPRRGIAAGALIEEVVTVDHFAACFGGLVSASAPLELPHPVEGLEVSADCGDDRCFSWISEESARTSVAVAADGGIGLTLGARVPPPPEPHRASSRPARIYVASEADPLAFARLLRVGLDDFADAWQGVARSYEQAARKAYPRIKDRSTRIATWLGEQPTLDDGPFHELGLDWGEPVEAKQRPLLPLERWALAWTLLREEGAVPFLLGRGDGAPPELASVQHWTRLGLLLPGRGVLLDDDYRPTLTGSTPALAGRWALHLDGQEPHAERFDSSASLRQAHREGTLTPTGNDSTKFAVVLGLAGYQALAWRESWQEWLVTWREAPPLRRRDIEDWEGRFVGSKLGRKLSAGRVKLPDEADRLTLVAHYGEPGTMYRGEGLTTMQVPLVLHPELSTLTPARRRHSDFDLRLADDRWLLQIAPPHNHRLVGLPPDESFSEGPLEVTVDWERQGDGARLDYRLLVSQKRVPASSAEAVWEVAAIVRRLQRTRLLFVQK
jgi:hypothetical protein